jgi:DNA (cytosine-5)-methyltransferase 1
MLSTVDMKRWKILDAYCCEGGASSGYAQAFGPEAEITGVDINPQPRYPYNFVQADAVQYIAEHGARYDFISTSPPCQFDSDCQRIMNREHPDLIGPTREALEATGRPWVIENVGGALPKLNDSVMLCGAMFGMRLTYRHRYFETGGWSLAQPEHPEHDGPQAKMGRRPRPGERIQAVGNYTGSPLIRDEWGVPWMTRRGTAEAVPPAYTEWIGRRFLYAQAVNG